MAGVHGNNGKQKEQRKISAARESFAGMLPPTLRIQADNTTQENKNIYMFSLCAALVGLGFFQEMSLC
ncbi:MAG TPA: hypothetical protein VEQ18_02125, partial [Candidatus Nitrosocosmicus sp.]|nr:hypothetical protein [Candidatus Nitrosocosmicus sp.]